MVKGAPSGWVPAGAARGSIGDWGSIALDVSIGRNPPLGRPRSPAMRAEVFTQRCHMRARSQMPCCSEGCAAASAAAQPI